MIGWSEGALFSQMYGIMREHISSPYGHKIKAVVAYSGSNPYHRKYEKGRDCESNYDFTTNLPIMLISRSCDTVSCAETPFSSRYQAEWTDTESMEAWEHTLNGDLKNSNVERLIVDDNGQSVSNCEVLSCTRWRAVKNHITWPVEQEEAMLRFLFSK